MERRMAALVNEKVERGSMPRRPSISFQLASLENAAPGKEEIKWQWKQKLLLREIISYF